MRPNSERARLAILFIWMVMGVHVISSVSLLMEYRILHRIEQNKYIDYYQLMEDTRVNTIIQTIITWLRLAIIIASAIMFIRWFSRAYFNLHQKIQNLTFSIGWAAWSWFIPFINLYRPYRIMKELFKATDFLLDDYKAISYQPTNRTLLRAWWFTWIYSMFLSPLILWFYFDNLSMGGWKATTIAQIFNHTIIIVCGLLVIRVMKEYVAKEELLYRSATNEEIDYATHLVD